MLGSPCCSHSPAEPLGSHSVPLNVPYTFFTASGLSTGHTLSSSIPVPGCGEDMAIRLPPLKAPGQRPLLAAPHPAEGTESRARVAGAGRGRPIFAGCRLPLPPCRFQNHRAAQSGEGSCGKPPRWLSWVTSSGTLCPGDKPQAQGGCPGAGGWIWKGALPVPGDPSQPPAQPGRRWRKSMVGTDIPSVASAEGSNRRREGPSPSKVLSGCLRPTQRRQARRRETLNSRGWDGLGLGTGHRVLRKPAVRGPRCPTPCVPNHPEDEAYALEVSDPGPQWAGLSQSNPVGSQHWRMPCGGHVTFNCSPRSRRSRDAGPAQSSLQAQTGLPSSPSVYSPGTSRLVHPEAPLTDGSRELGRGGGGRVMTHTSL